MTTTEHVLRKAFLETSDFGGPAEAPLSVEQVQKFIELMSAEQVLLRNVNVVTSTKAIWQEPIVEFAWRIARPGSELAERLADADRVAPDTGIVDLRTYRLKGEVVVTDEVFEDSVAHADFRSSLERLIASRFGLDIEDVLTNADLSSPDPLYADIGSNAFSGWIPTARDGKSGAGGVSGEYLGQGDDAVFRSASIDAAAYAQDYQEIFKQLLVRFNNRFLKTLRNGRGRYIVPVVLEQKWRDILSNRGTALGDFMLTEEGELRYQGIPFLAAPSFDLGIVAGTPDVSHIVLTNPKNLYAGFRRDMQIITYRDAREGVTSFIPTARIAAAIANCTALACARNVSVEP